MLTEKLVTMFNKKVWGKDIKILNFNEFDVFNVEVYKPKMFFTFDDENQVKQCLPNDLKEIELKVDMLLEIMSKDLHYPLQNIKFYKSTPINPINPDLLHLNCYFTPAVLERKFIDGYNKDKYFEFQDKMSYEEYLDKFSVLVRVSEPITRNEIEAEEFIRESPLFKEYVEKAKQEPDFNEKVIDEYIKITKESNRKDLECIDIDNKYIEGFSFKWCNGLYLTFALL